VVVTAVLAAAATAAAATTTTVIQDRSVVETKDIEKAPLESRRSRPPNNQRRGKGSR